MFTIYQKYWYCQAQSSFIVFQFYVMIFDVIIICTDYLVSELNGERVCCNRNRKNNSWYSNFLYATDISNILCLDCIRTDFIKSQADQNVSEIEVFKIPYAEHDISMRGVYGLDKASHG